VFTIKAVIDPMSLYSNYSSYDFTVVLDKVTARPVGVNTDYSDPTDRTGATFTAFKSFPVVTKAPVPSLAIINNQQIELYRYAVNATNGVIAQKQCAFEIILNDQTTDDTLFLKNFKVFEDGVDVTSQYRFTDANGFIDTLFSETDINLYCTKIAGTGEATTPVGGTKTWSFKASVYGFNHAGEGDGISVKLLGDATSAVGLKYLNTGGISNSNARLASTATAQSSAPMQNFLWSDHSALNFGTHSGQTGLSSNDWTNGEKVFSSLAPNVFSF
jgi:hypothetical protein